MPERRGGPAQLEVMLHPAAIAWSQLGQSAANPRAVVPVWISPGKSPKSAVYRLEGVGEDGGHVMAKRCRRTVADTERTIYEQVLPGLPLSSPRFLGMATGDDETCWLFMEDAGDAAYSPRSPAHRRIAGRWLGTLYASTISLSPAIPLPERGAAHYLQELKSARGNIRDNFGNPALEGWQREQLRGIIANCDLVELEWDRVEQFCRGIPTTLVHGDFIGKNVRMRDRGEVMEVLPFDWEVAGRGIPAVDLAQATFSSTRFLANPDLEAYWLTVQRTGLGFEVVQRLGLYGTIFRCLAALSWESVSLACRTVEWPVKNMVQYEAELMEAARAAGWRK